MPDTAVTLYPILFSIITAILPTPPDAPVTKTSFTFAPSNISSLALIANAAIKEVKPAVPKIIACLLVRSSGFLTKKSPLTFAICE